MIATVFENIFSKEPKYFEVKKCLQRIAEQKSKKRVDEIRASLDKEKANELKKNLPCVCFSGKFKKDRHDEDLVEHSGFLVLDFDDVADLRSKQTEIINRDFIYACWVSPSGKGLKALVKIADGSKHREHFAAIKEEFPLLDENGKHKFKQSKTGDKTFLFEVDGSGVNPSRVCYESSDPDIYINEDAKVFTRISVTERVYEKIETRKDDERIFKNLLTWLSNKNEAFATGERNNFLFKLASACCRYGIEMNVTENLISREFLNGSDFSQKEMIRTLRSAYRANAVRFGTASFDREVLVDRKTKKEVPLDELDSKEWDKTKDVIYGIEVKDKATALYDHGHEKLTGIGEPTLDYAFKPKRGEITVLTGIGNYGKSSFKKWYQLVRAVLYGEKFCSFCPEDNPPEEYYHDIVEILLGCDCTPSNPHRPSRQIYQKAYDFVCEHFFYVCPKEAAPTPTYIKEVFLSLIVKEQVDGCDIDPFNKMSNQYKDFMGRDKYLEFVLADFQRFAIMNDVYFWIIAHPVKMKKQPDGNYECPDVFDIADGAMWNNATDNILVYHRPFRQAKPDDPTAEFHSKKIRRQKTVGKPGFFLFQMLFRTRRFLFEKGGAMYDPLSDFLKSKGVDFGVKYTPSPKNDYTGTFLPYKDNDKNDPLDIGF